MSIVRVCERSYASERVTDPIVAEQTHDDLHSIPRRNKQTRNGIETTATDIQWRNSCSVPDACVILI